MDLLLIDKEKNSYVIEPEIIQAEIDKVNKAIEHQQNNLKYLYWHLYAVNKFKIGAIVPFLENEQNGQTQKANS